MNSSELNNPAENSGVHDLTQSFLGCALGCSLPWPGLPEHLNGRIGWWVSMQNSALSASQYPLNWNYALHVGDNPSLVAERRLQLQKKLNLQHIVWLKQMHGTCCVDVDSGEVITTLFSGDDQFIADAAVSRVPHCAAAVMTADCLPILLADETGGHVAAIHAGWRGLANGVIESSVNTLRQGLFNKKTPIYAMLGPAIGPNSFAVGQEVRDVFVQQNLKFAQWFLPQEISSTHFLANLYGLAYERLQVLDVCVQLPDTLYDTYFQKQWFSYRRNAQCGRMVSLIWPLS